MFKPCAGIPLVAISWAPQLPFQECASHKVPNGKGRGQPDSDPRHEHKQLRLPARALKHRSVHVYAEQASNQLAAQSCRENKRQRCECYWTPNKRELCQWLQV